MRLVRITSPLQIKTGSRVFFHYGTGPGSTIRDAKIYDGSGKGIRFHLCQNALNGDEIPETDKQGYLYSWVVMLSSTRPTTGTLDTQGIHGLSLVVPPERGET